MLRLWLILPALALALAFTPCEGHAGPLHEAARSGDFWSVKKLLAAGADLEAATRNTTAPRFIGRRRTTTIRRLSRRC